MNPIDICMRAHASWINGHVQVLIAARDVDADTREGSTLVADLTWRPMDLQVETDPPVVKLMPEQAQRLMDSLWEAGVRPAGAAGSMGQLAAVQAHLQDMRTLVFKKEGVV